MNFESSSIYLVMFGGVCNMHLVIMWRLHKKANIHSVSHLCLVAMLFLALFCSKQHTAVSISAFLL